MPLYLITYEDTNSHITCLNAEERKHFVVHNAVRLTLETTNISKRTTTTRFLSSNPHHLLCLCLFLQREPTYTTLWWIRDSLFITHCICGSKIATKIQAIVSSHMEYYKTYKYIPIAMHLSFSTLHSRPHFLTLTVEFLRERFAPKQSKSFFALRKWI